MMKRGVYVYVAVFYVVVTMCIKCYFVHYDVAVCFVFIMFSHIALLF